MGMRPIVNVAATLLTQIPTRLRRLGIPPSDAVHASLELRWMCNHNVPQLD